MTLLHADATSLAQAIQDQKVTATAVIEAVVEQITALDPAVNCFTDVLAESAMAQAEEVDRAIAKGLNPGPLAGFPLRSKTCLTSRERSPWPGLSSTPKSPLPLRMPPPWPRSGGPGPSWWGP